MGLSMKPRELIRFLEYSGYEFVRARGGSHHIYSNGVHTLPIPVHYGKDLSEGTILAIVKEMGLVKKDLLNYLGRHK